MISKYGDAKELIYSEFAKALDFDYKWDGFLQTIT